MKDITAPSGGNIFSVHLTVDYTRIWEEVVRVAGPTTPGPESAVWDVWNVWEMGYLDPARQKSCSSSYNAEIFFVDFGLDVSFTKILGWSETNRLRPASPRECFAIGECYPNLNHTHPYNFGRNFGRGTLMVLSPQVCLYRIKSGMGVIPVFFGVLWDIATREIVVHRLIGFGETWSNWFAFVDLDNNSHKGAIVL